MNFSEKQEKELIKILSNSFDNAQTFDEHKKQNKMKKNILSKKRQITNVHNFHNTLYEVYEENETPFVIYYSSKPLDYYKDENGKIKNWTNFHQQYGGHIGVNKNGKFELLLDRTFYQSDKLEELEGKLHQYNIEEDMYNNKFYENEN